MSFFKLIRISNLFILALSLSLFYYLILVPVHFNQLGTTLVPLTNFEFVLFVLSVIFIAAAGNIINDYFDFSLDKKFKPERPLPQAKISLDQAIYLHALFAFAGIVIGFYLGWKNSITRVGFLFIISSVLLYLYSAYLKKIPLAGNIVVAALAAFPFILLLIFEVNFLHTITFENGTYVFDILKWQISFYAGFAFLTNLAREIVKDIEDREGDAEFKVNTIAVQFGENAAKISVSFVLIILLAALSFFMKTFFDSYARKEFYYLLFAVALPVLAMLVLLFSAKEKKHYSRISVFLKIIMLLGILSIPAFYYFHKLSA